MQEIFHVSFRKGRKKMFKKGSYAYIADIFSLTDEWKLSTAHSKLNYPQAGCTWCGIAYIECNSTMIAGCFDSAVLFHLLRFFPFSSVFVTD